MRLLLPPLTEPEPLLVEAAPEMAVRLVSVRSPLDEAVGGTAPPTPSPPASLPDPRSVAGPLVLAAHEALIGARPLAQLTRWVTPEIYGRLTEALPRTRTSSSHGRARLVSVHAAPVSPTAAEVTVVVHDGTRVRAAAVRLEEHRGRWRATALDIG